MMTKTSKTNRAADTRARWRGLAFSVLLGAVGAYLAIRRGDVAYGVAAVVIMAAFGVWLAFGRDEAAVISSEKGDERQRAIDSEATMWSQRAVALVAVAGFLTEIASGQPGPFTLICGVGGLSHFVAVTVLRHRR